MLPADVPGAPRYQRCHSHTAQCAPMLSTMGSSSADDAMPERPGPTRIYLSPPDVGQLEEAYVLEAVRSGWIAPLGPQVDAFENELAARCQRQHAVALSSGTAALHLALLELGARPGSLVIVPTLTFVATANAVLYTGATPVFVDCDSNTGNLDPELLTKALGTLLTEEGRTVSAVISVDLLGKCADHAAIQDVCARYGVPILEDAAEALGALAAGHPAGSLGAASVLSFNGNKIMTTSGGGALLTNDGRVAARARYLSTQARQPAIHYEHTELGYNYRMSNLLAAVGRAQLQRLNDMLQRRRAIREHYASIFTATPGVRIFQREGDEHDNCWLTAILVDKGRAGWDTQSLRAHLDACNIESRPLWKPMHRQPLYRGSRSFLTGSSDKLFDTGLALPSGSGMQPGEIRRVDDAITEFLRGSQT